MASRATLLLLSLLTEVAAHAWHVQSEMPDFAQRVSEIEAGGDGGDGHASEHHMHFPDPDGQISGGFGDFGDDFGGTYHEDFHDEHVIHYTQSHDLSRPIFHEDHVIYHDHPPEHHIHHVHPPEFGIQEDFHADNGFHSAHHVDESHDHHIFFEDSEYDCDAGVSRWKTGWSASKQRWCCAHYMKGCSETNLLFDCDSGYTDWKATWSDAKKQWCCRNFAKACSVAPHFDCDAGFWNWQVGWSANKKAWCCERSHRGCQSVGSSPEHICLGHEEQWDACPDQSRCNPCTPVDCLFSQWSRWYDGADCIGLKFRHRSIEVRNNECGLPCFGSKMESEELDEPKPECLKKKQDCVFSSWSQWSVCQNQVDQAVRSRHVDLPPLHGGEPCKGSSKETRPCGGPEPKPCIFSDWHEWTSCSASCGEGTHSRMRRVASEDYLSGQTCENALMETKKCSMEPCPSRDCKLSHWSEWSPCTRDSLQKTRRRDVLISPEGQGMGCNVSLVEAAACDPLAGEDCVISEWSDWSSCDKSCHGGQSYRHRRIMHYNTHGGSCDISSLQEVTSCNTEPCNGATKNCEMLNWEPWSVCSQQTGTGLASRKRQLAGATGDGKACNGTTVELKSCMIAAAEVVDCAWGGWVEWSSCTRTCGGGSKRRSRAVEQAPRNGGKACEAKNKEEVTACHDEPCSGECLNGKWGDWTAWGACSAQCGNAFKVRRRAVAVLPNACGAMPEGPREEFSLCSGLPLCEQDSDCRLSLWTEWSLCSRECRGVRERLRTIVAFARGNGAPCSEESLKEISDCNPILGEAAPPACGEADAQDCLLQDWSLWSGCSRTCGSGEQLRKRIVLQPSSNGGRPCEGNLTVVRGCNAQPCHVEEVKDCKWAAWSDWGDCTHCGGQRTRHRVIQQLPTAGGKLCEEKDAKEISNCTSHCGSRRFCVWSEWTGTGCATCGGTSMRSRALNLVEADADAFFIGSEDSSCFGSQLNVSSCPKEDCTRECVRVDCEFGDWSDWNEPTCVGLCERQRVVTQVNSECGTPCSGALLETRVCTPTCDQPVDCELSDWADWSACSNSTGYLRGQRYRRRHVTQPPVHGGLACYGDLEQTKACKGSLPDPCEFSAWQSWSICSTTCGEGFQSRGRSIEQAEPGGMQCSGMLEEVRDCHAGLWQDCGLGHSQDCIFDMWSEWTACGFTMQRQRERVFKQPALLGGLPCMGPMHEVETCHRPPVDCVVSDWTEWDECDRSCGAGQARRQRQVVTFPEHGGQLCPSDLTQMKACSLPNCNIQDCQVSGWLDWGDCSTSCGDGIQSRLRSVLNLREPGGFGCFFSVAENRDCHHPACTVDCAWEDWNDWSACSQSCGGGLKMRSRGIHSMPEGGKSCDEKDMQEVLPCNLGSCNEHCVDGLWDEWESWSPCSASCGGGVAFRRREVKLMANSCGNPAVGDDKETRFCNVGVHCNGDKDCLYTGWSSWNDCSATCNGITVRRRSIATYGHGNGLFCQGALEEVGPCNPAEGYAPPEHCVEGPAVDCKLSEWTPWTGCSASCDGGEQRRHRHVLQHPRHGGEPCKGSLDEIQECARDHCGGGHPVDCVYGDWKEWAECHKCSGERKRIRHILVYPAEGGRECAPADLEEVGVCPNPCAEELFCSWQSWSDWGSCSMSCGPGGKRSRTRQLEKVMKPLNFANAQTDAKSAHSGPEHRKLIEKYHALFARTRSLEEGQTKEILLAFSAGFLALLALAGLARRVRFEYAAVSQEAQASDTEAPLVASL